MVKILSSSHHRFRFGEALLLGKGFVKIAYDGGAVEKVKVKDYVWKEEEGILTGISRTKSLAAANYSQSQRPVETPLASTASEMGPLVPQQAEERGACAAERNDAATVEDFPSCVVEGRGKRDRRPSKLVQQIMEGAMVGAHVAGMDKGPLGKRVADVEEEHDFAPVKPPKRRRHSPRSPQAPSTSPSAGCSQNSAELKGVGPATPEDTGAQRSAIDRSAMLLGEVAREGDSHEINEEDSRGKEELLLLGLSESQAVQSLQRQAVGPRHRRKRSVPQKAPLSSTSWYS